MLFLAGAIGHPIQQHCNLSGHHDLYRTLVPPCSCADTYGSVVHILWTNLSLTPGGCPNHIIPLIEKHTQGHIQGQPILDHVYVARSVYCYVADMSACNEVEQACLMWGDCSGSLGQGKKVNWVICRTCQAWYHTVCVGLSPKLTTQDDFNFSCCSSPSSKDNMVYVYVSSTIITALFQREVPHIVAARASLTF